MYNVTLIVRKLQSYYVQHKRLDILQPNLTYFIDKTSFVFL